MKKKNIILLLIIILTSLLLFQYWSKNKVAEKAKLEQLKIEEIEEEKEKQAELKKIEEEKDLIWYTDVKKAVDISVKTKKPLFFFFTGSDWCGWCIRLQKAVFFKPEFKKWAQKSVVLVELDFPRRSQLPEATMQQNRELAQMFGVRGYPTIWFVSADIAGEKINFNKLGSQGASPLEANTWIENANKILKN